MMKMKFLMPLAFIALIFASCNDDDATPVPTEPSVSYVLNYGSYTGDKSTVTAFDKETGLVTANYYENVNGVAITSNVQHALNYNGNIYFLGNNPDQLFWVDSESFIQSENAITTDIIKPRFAVAEGKYLYVSCWGGDIWADETLSYIAKVNIMTKSVEKKIELPGGPEGLAIANNKLYAALNYKDSIAIMDLATDGIEYMETPAVSSFFIEDKSGNLYVSFVSTFSDYSDETGLGYINTATDQLESIYFLEGVSTSYVNILSANNDFSKLYVMTSAYDANWNLSGAVSVFDVATTTFESANLAEGISGLNGIGFYNDKIFTFVSESVTGNGKAVVYNPDGTEASNFVTGISPFMIFTAE